MPNDGTAADALREGLRMLASAGLDVHGDPAVLLPALYAGLVAGGHEDLSDAGERAVAWALGLSEDSPLVPVTDVLLVAPQRGLDLDTALRHLFGIPAFSERAGGRPPVAQLTWNRPDRPGLRTRSPAGHQPRSKVIRLGQDGAAMIEAQRRFFEEKFGRPPGPDDPLFFDPDADEPQPMSLPGVETATVSMLEAAGISRHGSTPTSTRTDFCRARWQLHQRA